MAASRPAQDRPPMPDPITMQSTSSSTSLVVAVVELCSIDKDWRIVEVGGVVNDSTVVWLNAKRIAMDSRNAMVMR